MQRVKRSTAVALLPTAPEGGTPGYFAEPDPTGGIPATVPGFEWFNNVQEEICAVIESASLALDENDRTQLVAALIKKGMQGNYFSIAAAAGTADAITAVFTPVVDALTNGMTFHVRAGAANATTTPTFTPATGTIAAKTIVKGNNLPLAVGDIAGAGYWLTFRYDQALDKWVLENPATGIISTSRVACQGTFKNLKASATGLSANIVITADELILEDADNTYVTARDVNVTINSAAAGANGLDTGVLAASTWYARWIIRKPDGTTAGLISLSATAPTLPAGYTYKACVGWMRTDPTANKYPLAFVQAGREVQYKVAAGSNVPNLPIMSSGASIGSVGVAGSVSAIGVGNFVPPTAVAIAVSLTSSATGCSSVITPNNQFGGDGSTSNPPIGVDLGSPGQNPPVRLLLESSNIYLAANAAYALVCLGWTDNF